MMTRNKEKQVSSNTSIQRPKIDTLQGPNPKKQKLTEKTFSGIDHEEKSQVFRVESKQEVVPLSEAIKINFKQEHDMLADHIKQKKRELKALEKDM